MILGSGKKKRKTKAMIEIGVGGWGALGSSLLGIGSVLKGDYAGALLYASLLAPSVYGILKGKKRLKGGDMKGYGNKKHLSIAKIKKMMKAHPSNLKKIHISDLKLSRAKISKILNVLKRGHPLEGSGLKKLAKKGKKKLKKGFHKSKEHLGKFFRGETSYKPSDLLGHISMATGAASAFLGPEFMIPSVAASLGSKYLKSKGKGLKIAGQTGSALAPAGTLKPYRKCPRLSKVKRGSGLSLPGSGLSLPGAGLSLAGQKGGDRLLEGHLEEHTGAGYKGGRVKKRGSRVEVMNGSAMMTSGKLTKNMLYDTGKMKKNKRTGQMERHIKSKKKMALGKLIMAKNKSKMGGRYH